MARTNKANMLMKIRERINARVDRLMDIYEGRVKVLPPKKPFQGNQNPIKCGKGDMIRKKIKKDLKEAGFEDVDIE